MEEEYLHYIDLIHKSLDMLKERDGFIIGKLHRCYERKQDEVVHFSESKETSEEQFPPSGRAVQEKRVESPFGEVAPVDLTKQREEAREIPSSTPGDKTSISAMDSLDNFSGKVEGEGDELEGKAVEEELEGFAGKDDNEDDLLTGDAVRGSKEKANLHPAAAEEGKSDPAALDWGKKKDSGLPSVDIGKIKSILDKTAN